MFAKCARPFVIFRDMSASCLSTLGGHAGEIAASVGISTPVPRSRCLRVHRVPGWIRTYITHAKASSFPIIRKDLVTAYSDQVRGFGIGELATAFELFLYYGSAMLNMGDSAWLQQGDILLDKEDVYRTPN